MLLSHDKTETSINDSYELPNNVFTAVPRPMVTVRTSTYQHAPYIEKCIKGILMQKTTFPIEFIIGEDFSTDGTREIVFDYASRYPNIIRVLTADYNVGMKANGLRCIRASRGKYMAICEGDDYWVDPYKLQRHVDFLENNDDYVMVYSDFTAIDEMDQRVSVNIISRLRYLMRRKEGYVLNSLITGNFIMTLTTLVRMDKLLEAEACMAKEPIYISNIDYTLFLELSRLGKFHYDCNKTACYRILSESASHSDDINKRLSFINRTIKISTTFNERYNIGYHQDYFERIKLGSVLSEFAKKRLYKEYFVLLFNGLKNDWKNIYNVRIYLSLMYLLIKGVRNAQNC